MFERVKMYWKNSSTKKKIFIVVFGMIIIGAIAEPSPKPAPALTKEEMSKALSDYKLSKMTPEQRRVYEDTMICLQYKMERTQNPKITLDPLLGCH